MGRVNLNLLAAAYAIEHDMGFQMSAGVCPTTARDLPYCFFQPVSHCGATEFSVNPRSSHLGAFYERRAPSDPPERHRENRTWLALAERSANVICSSLGKRQSLRCHADATRLELWRAVAQLVLAPQPDILDKVHSQYLAPLTVVTGLDLHATYAAMHIRRGDRRLGRANDRAAMLPACAFADALESRLSNASSSTGMHVFVATDEAAALQELRQCAAVQRHAWKIVSMVEQHGDLERERRAKTGKQVCGTCHTWEQGTALRLWAEMTLMVHAAYVVGQFRSNVDTVVQMLRWQAPSTYVSLDAFKKDRWGPW